MSLRAFAIKGNHFHLALFELQVGGIEALMNGVMTSYVRYFNKKHGKDGPLFRGEYRSVPKPGRRAAMNLIAYVHDNHGPDCRCEFCSHRYFAAGDPPGWFDLEPSLALFGGRSEYNDYRAARRRITQIAGDPLY